MQTFIAQQATDEGVAEATANGFSNMGRLLIDQFAGMGRDFIEYLPVLVIGLVLLIAGVLIAKVIRAIIAKIGRKFMLDAASEKLGIKDALARLGLHAPMSKLIANLIYWIMIIFFLKSATDIMGIKDISTAINNFIAFLPRLFISAFILLGGMMVTDLARGFVRTTLEKIEFDYGGLVANFFYGLLAIMIITVVLGQLGIEAELLNATVKIFLGAISLAIAIALGFGLRPVARNVVSGVYARDLFTPGSIIEVDGVEATVVEVGAVATRLEQGGNRFFVIPNSHLVSEITKGKHGISNYSEKSD